MHLQVSKRTNKDGSVRKYGQLAVSYRCEETGKPRKEIVANLGRLQDWEIKNWKRLLEALRNEQTLEFADVSNGTTDADSAVRVTESLQYLPVAVVASWFEKTGLYELLGRLTERPPRAAPAEDLLEALVAHRCIEPGSKRAFQTWLDQVSCQEVFGVERERLNNTRVHRVLEELAELDEPLQKGLTRRRLEEGTPRIVYLDLTDVWFESGGGTDARRAPTKAGHRWKLKIHVALLVDEDGMPLQWEFLSGALNEAPQLRSWHERLRKSDGLEESVLIFDRGMQSVENFERLADEKTGRPFLSSVRRSTISSYVELDDGALDALQEVPSDVPVAQIRPVAESAGFEQLDAQTFVRELGVVEPPVSANGTDRPPPLKMYLYFNPELQRDKRETRRNRFRKLEEYIGEVNAELREAQRSRQPEPTRRKATRKLEKMNLLECFDVHLEPYPIEGSTTTIDSYQIELEPDEDQLQAWRRYDGLTLLVGHPDLEWTGREAVEAYRHSSTIEANFKAIKSDFEVRPVHHETDPKIHAHIILCILALHVERAVEGRLDAADEQAPKTAQHLWEELDDVRLHRLQVDDTTATVRTTASESVRGLVELLDEEPLLKEVNASTTFE